MKNKLFCLLLIVFSSKAQEIKKDTLSANRKLNYKALIIPSLLIGYGFIGIESDQIKGFNAEIKNELNENIDEKITIDDFSQYLPLASVYALNAFGIKGKNNFKDRTIIAATSYLLVSGSVMSIKSVTKVQRPDGSSFNSFPSGHTATAFAGAELLWQEYKDVSVLYGISGFLVAAGTGYFRMYNDRHWLTDVAAGAGIGILCTKTAYWLHPHIKKLFYNNQKSNSTALIAPFYNGNQLGMSFVAQF
jgi:hypothetical protein